MLEEFGGFYVQPALICKTCFGVGTVSLRPENFPPLVESLPGNAGTFAQDLEPKP